ncbi:flagellin [Eubacteriaceae bacterium ES3]|nr:flagellin [Eubacteriaceae bacterium ES3]
MWNERNLVSGSTIDLNTFYGISEPSTLPSLSRIYDIILQTGANSGNEFKVELSDVRTLKLGVSDLNLSTRMAANGAIDTIDKAIGIVLKERSKYGAYQNGLEHIINNVDNTSENLRASESRIADVDMAKEMMTLTKANILVQASSSMLAQSNNINTEMVQGLIQSF